MAFGAHTFSIVYDAAHVYILSIVGDIYMQAHNVSLALI